MGGRGSGWFGDPEGHARAGEEGGRKKSSKSKNGQNDMFSRAQAIEREYKWLE